jgi:hypothetical protein
MPLIRNKLEPGDVDSFLEEENFPCQQEQSAAAAFAGFGHRPIPMFLESKAKRPRKPVKCLCNMLDKDETNPELLAQSERCRELAKRFKALGDIRGCVTAYPTLAAKGGEGGNGGGIVSEIKRRKSQRWCHYLLPPQRSSIAIANANDNRDAASLHRAELLTFDNRVRNHIRKGRAKTYNKKKGRLKDPPANGSAAADNSNSNNNHNDEENQDSTNQGTESATTAEGDAAAAAAQPAAEPVSNSQPNDAQTATGTGAAAAAAAAAVAAARPPGGIKRRLAFVAWHHFHPLLIRLLCRDDPKRLYRCPDTVPAWLVHRFDDVEWTYRNRDDWSGPNEAYFVPSYPLERAEQDCRATLYQCQLNATIDRAVAQRWGPFEEQRSGMVVAAAAAAAAPDSENDDANDDDRDHEDPSDGENGHRPRIHHDHAGNGGMYMYSDDDASPRYYDPYAEPSPPRHHHQNRRHNHPQQLPPSHAAPWNRTSPLHRTGPATAVVRAGVSAPATAKDGPSATTTKTAINISNDAKAVRRGRRLGILKEDESSWQQAAGRLFEERNRLQECVCLLMAQACCDAQLDDDRAGDDVRKLEGVVGALQRQREEWDKSKEAERQKQREAEAAAAKAKANAAKAKAKRERRRNKRKASETTDAATESLGEDVTEADPAETSKKRKATTPKRKGPQIHKRGTAADVRASVVAEASSKVPGEAGAVSTGPATTETSLPHSTGSPPDAAAASDMEVVVVDLTASPTTPLPASPLLDVDGN